MRETPPRTWRRPWRPCSPAAGSGNTSTDVEKTRSASDRLKAFRKHLHGRGEDPTFAVTRSGTLETPPRTWRRLAGRCGRPRFLRNTSTDVEKTNMHQLGFNRRKKHLHGRGEDLTISNFRLPERETPPRTWRRPNGLLNVVPRSGNTSTDVEKTRLWMSGIWPRKKHLHGRGEDEFQHLLAELELETPPRTWRRLFPHHMRVPEGGNTSTDVEKTRSSNRPGIGLGKHLHGRGEDCKI